MAYCSIHGHKHPSHNPQADSCFEDATYTVVIYTGSCKLNGCRLVVLATRHAVLSSGAKGGTSDPWAHREFLPKAWTVYLKNQAFLLS